MRKRYTEVNVDVNVCLEDILQDFSRDDVLDALGEPEPQVDSLSWLNDPIKRLEVIVWLRSNGWEIEYDSRYAPEEDSV